MIYYKSVIAVIVSIGVCFFSGTALAKPSTIAILPYDIQSDKNLNYLSEALIEVTASRLFDESHFKIIDIPEILKHYKKPIQDKSNSSYLKVLNTFSAKYILSVSLIQKETNLLLSAVLVSKSTLEQPKKYSFTISNAESTGEIITLINRLCDSINQDLFGIVSVTPTTEPVKNESYNIHSHPDNLLETIDLSKKK